MAEMSGGWLGDPSFVRRLAPVAVLGGFLILADQAGQMAAGLPGFEPGYPVWRFQAATMLTSRFTGLGLAALVLLGTAVWTGRRGTGLAAGLVLGLTLMVLAGAVAILWFDGPLVKDQVQAARLIEFILRWVRVLVMASLGLLAGTGILIGWWRGRAVRIG